MFLRLLLSFAFTFSLTRIFAQLDDEKHAFIGTYTAHLPCADCAGIRYSLEVRKDDRFVEKIIYEGKHTAPHIDSGTYRIDTLLRLQKNSRAMSIFRTNPGGLLMLDANGNTITGRNATRYILKRVSRNAVMETQIKTATEKTPSSLKIERQLFTGSGHNPEWSLVLTTTNIRFSRSKGKAFIFPLSSTTKAADANVTRYTGEAGGSRITIQTIWGNCTDQVQLKLHSYQATIDLQEAHSKAAHYSGCGDYIPDSRLDAVWILKKINGADADPSIYGKGIPDIVIDIKQLKYSGNAGCNRMTGKLTLNNDNIRFGNAALTRMMCANDKGEATFLQTLQSVTSYQVEENKLILLQGGQPVLEFEKK